MTLSGLRYVLADQVLFAPNGCVYFPLVRVWNSIGSVAKIKMDSIVYADNIENTSAVEPDFYYCRVHLDNMVDE
jgi:hypothetical protein